MGAVATWRKGEEASRETGRLAVRPGLPEAPSETPGQGFRRARAFLHTQAHLRKSYKAGLESGKWIRWGLDKFFTPAGRSG